jgi:hypothetical protein
MVYEVVSHLEVKVLADDEDQANDIGTEDAVRALSHTDFELHTIELYDYWENHEQD